VTETRQVEAGPLDVGKNTARGLAALVVVLDHAYGLFIEPYVGGATAMSMFWGQAAHQAVCLFFTVSGFLITKSILDNMHRNGTFDFLEFISSRVARIYPPLIFSVGLCLLFMWCIHGLNLPGSSSANPYQIGSYPQMREAFQFSGRDVIGAFQMNNGLLLVNGPLWSLCIEWWIYVAVGFFAYLITCSGWGRKIIAGVLLTWSFWKLAQVNQYSYFYSMVWLSGSLIAVCNRHYGWFRNRNPGILLLLLISILTVGISFPNLILAGGRIFGFQENLAQMLVVAFWCALVLPEMTQGQHIVWRALNQLGNCSYTLYIAHFPVMMMTLSVYQFISPTTLSHSIAAALMAGLLSLTVSLFSATIFENKNLFLNWFRREFVR